MHSLSDRKTLVYRSLDCSCATLTTPYANNHDVAEKTQKSRYENSPPAASRRHVWYDVQSCRRSDPNVRGSLLQQADSALLGQPTANRRASCEADEGECPERDVIIGGKS